jgi:hypothetical protein
MEGNVSELESAALTASVKELIKRLEKQQGNYPGGIIPVGVLISELERAHPGIGFCPGRPDSANHITSIDVFSSMGSFKVKIGPDKTGSSRERA